MKMAAFAAMVSYGLPLLDFMRVYFFLRGGPNPICLKVHKRRWKLIVELLKGIAKGGEFFVGFFLPEFLYRDSDFLSCFSCPAGGKPPPCLLIASQKTLSWRNPSHWASAGASPVRRYQPLSSKSKSKSRWRTRIWIWAAVASVRSGWTRDPSTMTNWSH